MPKILVIEDEAALRDTVTEWLILEGYDVICAEDGLVGLERAFNDLPDLIISDLMMPNLDGLGVLHQVRSNPVSAHIPFIMSTAKSSDNDLRRVLELGANACLLKPFSLPELSHVIQEHLAKNN